MKQILIVEPDEQFAGRLFQALVRAGDYQISSALTVREGCLIVGRQEQDLAFVPLADLEGTVEALRRLQPDLPIVVTVPGTDDAVPRAYVGQVQGILPRPAISLGLPDLLAKVEEQAAHGGRDPSAAATGSGYGGLAPLLQGSALPETILAALISRGEQLLAHGGTLSADQAEQVAQQVSASWKSELTGQIQFILLPSRTTDLQLYTRPVAAGMLLTLVSRAETKMETLRRQADKLAQQVLEAAGPVTADPDAASEPALTVRVREQPPREIAEKSYALIWRSVGPLPAPLQIALRRALDRIASENGCVLTYLSVDETLVHLVVSCRPERSSAWIAHLFKREAEAAIQSQFGVEKQLWQKGYYAVEGTTPVSGAELNLIMQKEA